MPEADTGHVTLIAEGTSPLDMLLHPRHEAAQKVLPELITQLRQCTNVEEGYEFQKALLDHVLVAETDRNGFSQAVKRMRAGKPPQADAPEPQSGFDVWLSETWEFERDVCARVARQFRCVGDALAWRVFGFQRQHIIALSQSAPPGVMASWLDPVYSIPFRSTMFSDVRRPSTENVYPLLVLVFALLSV